MRVGEGGGEGEGPMDGEEREASGRRTDGGRYRIGSRAEPNVV